MLKRILFILFVFVIAGYILVTFIVSSKITDNNVCNGINVVMVNNEDNLNIVSGEQLISFLKKNKLGITGYRISDLDVEAIETVLMKHPLVKNAECYVSPDNNLVLEVWQKKPAFRVIDFNGRDYYMDSEGLKIDNIDNFVSYLPLVTGHVDSDFIKNELYDFLNYVKDDSFWSSQIEQIYVKENHDVVIVPRVGENTILMGQAVDFKTKLDKVKTFYEKGLSVVGWNKYKNINVEFEGQIIAEKR